MTDTRNHRRHGNAFRAGGREMLDDLIALTPPEAHANLRAIYAARAALPKWAKQAPTAADMMDQHADALRRLAER